LFGEGEDGAETRLPLPVVEDWPAMARLRHEFEAIGFYLSAHPLDAFGETLGRLGVVAAADLEQDLKREPGRKRLAGILIGKQERTSRSGNRFAFVQFSDKSGVFEAVVFTELLGRSRELLESGGPLLLTVAVEVRSAGEPPRLTLQDVQDLELAAARRAGGLRVYLNDLERLESLKSLLGRAKGEAAEANGRPGRVRLMLDLAERGEVEMELPGAYRLPAEIRQAIKAIPGVNVQDL
jgi:DNA polymerase-3 subunit alpha